MLKNLIDLLSDDTKSLASALLKVKVLASRIGNQRLLNWVNNEIDGYGSSQEVPEYRIAKASVRGDIGQGFYEERGVTLPIIVFGEEIARRLVGFRLDSGVRALESIAHGEFGDTIVRQFGADFCAMLTDAAKKNGQNLTVIHAWTDVHVSEVVQSLSEIRSKLLDLLLQLEKEFPNLDKELESNTVNKDHINQTIVNVMNTIHTTGDGNIINTGDNATINANIKIRKGDLGGLQKTLKEIAVPEEEIREISEIVKSEAPDAERKILGPRANGWITKMIGKTLDKSWAIATGTAGGILTELLKNYFGL